MSDPTHDADATAPPLEFVASAVKRTWRDLLSVYYANTPIWRLLKSVALLFFGFFCWSAASLLLSYRSDWTFLQYVMAYGFVLILWGPLTHAVLVPLIIRLRRTAEHPAARWLARNGSKVNLSVFFLLVLVLGTAPISPMMLDFQSSLQGEGSSDVNPDLLCSKADSEIHCHLSESEGIDHVVVSSGDKEIETVEDPPFAFDVRENELEEVVGQRELVVELRDEDGETIRRYRRSVSMIPEG